MSQTLCSWTGVVIISVAAFAFSACDSSVPAAVAPPSALPSAALVAASVTPQVTVPAAKASVINNYAPILAQQIGNNNTAVIKTGPEPRNLSVADQLKMATLLKPFGGLKVNVFQYDLGEPEIVSVTGEIERVLSSAGLIVTECTGKESGDKRSERPLPGILVEVRQPVALAQKAAEILAESLRSSTRKVDGPLPYDGFGRGSIMCSGTDDPSAALQVTIGRNNGFD